MIFLYLAYLFFLGSLAGWVMEVLFRKFFSDSNPEHKWINPGFCVGPYVPLYGFGLCFLYLLADFGEKKRTCRHDRRHDSGARHDGRRNDGGGVHCRYREPEGV